MTDSPTSFTDLFTQWQVDWITLTAAVVVGGGYLRIRLAARHQGFAWPLRRDAFVAVGLAAAVWTSCGFLQEQAGELMWVWTAQQLLLLLVIPIVVLAGQPVALLRRTAGDRSMVLRALDSRPLRTLAHPMIGPLLVPVVAGLLFFGGLGALALQSTAGGWALHLTLLGLGALIALPLVDQDDRRSSLAVGLALGVGILELLLDAFPGIALTFDGHLTLTHFAANPAALDDQHTAGAILWAVAEVLDLPFLVLVATRWMRADALEASRIDAELDARAAAGTPTPGVRPVPAAEPTASSAPVGPVGPAGSAGPVGLTGSAGPVGPAAHPDTPPLSRPWWLDDEQLRDRYRH